MDDVMKVRIEKNVMYIEMTSGCIVLRLNATDPAFGYTPEYAGETDKRETNKTTKETTP